MAHETDLTATHFIEGSTPRITYTLKDEAGAVITAALTTQEASIYDAKSKQALSAAWTDMDINGAQGNSVTDGIGTWDLPAAATARIGGDEVEDHIILMKFTYGVDRVGKHKVKVQIHRQPVGTV